MPQEYHLVRKATVKNEPVRSGRIHHESDIKFTLMTTENYLKALNEALQVHEDVTGGRSPLDDYTTYVYPVVREVLVLQEADLAPFLAMCARANTGVDF